MKKLNQKGIFNLLLIPLILISLLLIAAIAFGFYSHGQEQKYKTKTDKIVAANVKTAQLKQQTKDTQLYQEKAKQPLVTYNGSSDYGSLQISYPKTWSVYVAGSGSGMPIDGYAYPGQVPGVSNNQNTSYALRFQITSESYDQLVQDFDGQLQEGKVTISPFQLKKVPSIMGVRVDGEIQDGKQGSMVILPLRSDTLEFWTEAKQFVPDFNKYILPNFSFKP